MKKILLAFLVFGAIAATAEDSYLYWMVGENSNASGFTYDTVKVSANGGGPEYLTIYNGSGSSLGSTVSKTTVDNYASLDRGLYASLAGLTDSASFVIELWNDGNFVAQSTELDWSTAMQNYVATYNSMSLPTAWAATSFAIPEPNSAMLLMIGCAALGLRRRRQRKV